MKGGEHSTDNRSVPAAAASSAQRCARPTPGWLQGPPPQGVLAGAAACGAGALQPGTWPPAVPWQQQ